MYPNLNYLNKRYIMSISTEDINTSREKCIDWLKAHDATDVHEYSGEELPVCEGAPAWDYYRSITANVCNTYVSITFMVYRGEPIIDLYYNNNSNWGLSAAKLELLLNNLDKENQNECKN
jgi:hypothetical protein